MVTCFLPAVDVRHGGSGAIRAPGVNGFFWSSTPYLSVNAWNLWLNSTNVSGGLFTANIRVFGFSVRCVQEFIEKIRFKSLTFCFVGLKRGVK